MLLLRANHNSLIVTPQDQASIADLFPFRTSAEPYLGRRLVLAGTTAAIFKWLLLLDGVAAALTVLPSNLAIDWEADGLGEYCLTDQLNFRPAGAAKVLIDTQIASPLPPLPGFHAQDTPGRRTTDTEWLIASSGTTGASKFVSHSCSSLCAPFKGRTAAGRLRWGMLYDPARFAGVQVLLQAILCGDILLAPRQNWGLPRKVEWFVQQSCNALSATPSLWRQILACPASRQLPLAQITLGGEICDAAILEALRKGFPAARITQIYAATEVGVVFSVHDGQPGFPALWLEAGTKNCKLRVAPDDTLEVTRSGPSENEDWLNTGDIVEQVGDRVYFKGRKSGLINIGGNKVYPEEVEAAVASVEGVESVLVCARTSSMMGSLLEAHIVPTGSATPNLAERVRLHCQEVLPRFKQPAFIKIVTELPTNANGKRVRMESR
jgi:acyl-CoA synthetase (AMP-forming)/AMP-acid ligase II